MEIQSPSWLIPHGPYIIFETFLNYICRYKYILINILAPVTGTFYFVKDIESGWEAENLPNLPRNTGCIYGSSSSLDQIYRLLSKDGLSSDFAENSRVLFGNHTLLCELFKKRAEKKPSFLQRDLCYKIQAKQNKRIQITISLSGSSNAEVQAQNIFPLYALIAKPISTILYEGHSPVYQFTRACLLTCFDESGRDSHTEATFIIEDLKTLANIILVSCGQFGQSPDENNCSKNQLENSSLRKLGGQCFWGNIPNDLLHSSLGNCVDLSLGRTKKFALPVTMSPGFGETKFLEQDSFLTFCSLKFNAVCPYQLKVSIRAQTTGARYMFKSPYNSYLYNDVPPSYLPHIVSLRNGNVRFKYGNDIFDATEVTEGFCCSFCYVKCGSFLGLQWHLMSSHDRFNFEFWISEKEQGVNVSLKHNAWRDEVFPAGIDPRQRTFSYFSKYKKRRRLVTATEAVVPSKDTEMIVPSKVTETIVPSKTTKRIVLSKATETIRHGPLLGVGSKSPEDAHVSFEDSYVQKEIDTSVDPAYSLHDGHLSPPRVIQFGKTRRLSVDQFDPKLRQVLRTRQFFHSHKGQQMTVEEVLSNHDSEDEVDDDVADFEDRKMLDSFDGIAIDEKRVMHMWNSFVSRQRVIADSHIPFACKAFSQLHGQLLARSPSLLGCWRLFMIKLWNHNLLNGNTMNACNLIIDGFKN
ncbi:unnamed protein product [Miscanthus lutarioriparius]|uniref:Polycomb protein VEFS-Box domain-containing protein n=1 Tax=Miscanthus lutarioriparius TaxID=422564 RepID=A0A811QQL6_9POAL|nr:unnamed protein product [Miscanthus lutarioriparius]